MKRSLLPLIVMVVAALFAGATMVYAAQADKKIVSMKKHEGNVSCEQCHGVKTPPAKADQAKLYAACLSCHANSGGTYKGELDANGNGIEKEYPESGKTKMAAIHDAHVGPLRCTLCHTSHRVPDSGRINVKTAVKAPAEGKFYCNYCHQFDIKIK